MLILGAIRSALQEADDIEVVGVTHSGAEVMGLVERERPDVVLLDNRMPGVDGLTCLKLIKERHPEIKVLMLSASEDPKVISEALAAGASAYIGKRINPQDLASAVRQVVAGVVYYQSAVPTDLEQPAKAHNGAAEALTSRERTMLEAISRGMSTKAISNDLWISEKTVKFHLTNIYRKLGVHNRTGAMRYAYEHDLIPSPVPAEQAPLSDIG
ncbi:MAG: two-component system, NarL family, nitrate/nitrite response regulator NarL [Solirubrobacteraceae bacterium]|jgi:DNA-binding NarL/FixJ family response regulator|nr:two-component system, NarL family, nitrate/nitrite response regulator NarL [Solirubrobacteraceae bacterium]